MTDDKIDLHNIQNDIVALESKVESLLRNTSPNIADSIKEIFERLSELEKTVRSSEEEEEYDDEDKWVGDNDDPEDYDNNDDDESDKHCPSCTCNDEPDKQ